MEPTVLQRLWQLQDVGYRAFMSRLLPTLDPQQLIGVRTPALQGLARELSGTELAAEFLRSVPHHYFEENGLHIALLARIRDFDTCLAAVNAFLPYVDNWAICDSLLPPVFGRHRQELLPVLRQYLCSEHPYTVRFGIGLLLRHFLGSSFTPAYPAMVAAVRSEEYYVNMMRAWYFATALTVQTEAVLGYFTDKVLDKWTHNKSLQKAIESRRLPLEQKNRLRALKRK